MKEISQYIVKNEEDDSIRFFVIGWFIDDKFTGIMHDYLGGGQYSEALVYNDKFVEMEQEWDDQIAEWETKTKIHYDRELSDYVESKYIEYSADIFNYIVLPEQIKHFSDRVLIDNCSLHIPYGLGNTTFINGYQID